MNFNQPLQVIDAQIHIWANALPENPLHRQVMSFTAEDAIGLMDDAGVDAAVITPPSWHPGAIDLARAAVRDYSGRFAVMGLMPLEQPVSQSLEQILGWRTEPGILGLRFSFRDKAVQQRLNDGELDDVWAAAETAGVPLTTLSPDHLPELGEIAERYPGLRLSIDHLGGLGGNTPLKDAEAMTHIPDLLALAKHSNIAVKATGLPGYSDEAYPYPVMQDYLKQVFDAFGPERVFWGTDISKMPCSWRECVTMFTEDLPWLNEHDKKLVMGEALCAWWGWDRRS